MKFKGSIVITDPCYILKEGDYTDGYCMPEDFTDYICRNTIYGDWSCMTYKGTPDTDLPAQRDEALKYNPEFETFIKEHPWCVTVIEDFDGEDDSLMLIGTGNKPFFTIQSGL